MRPDSSSFSKKKTAELWDDPILFYRYTQNDSVEMNFIPLPGKLQKTKPTHVPNAQISLNNFKKSEQISSNVFPHPPSDSPPIPA